MIYLSIYFFFFSAFADDIFSYINKSRTLIIILCAELLENESSMYGLMSGLHQVLVERLIKPILIEYNPIRDITFLPQSLQLILKSNRTVKWTNESLLQNSYFWKRIRYLMPAKCIKRTQFYWSGRCFHIIFDTGIWWSRIITDIDSGELLSLWQ